MGELDQAIKSCVDVFVKYSGEDSDCLSADEFKTVLENEITASDFKGKLSLSDVDEAFNKVDKNDNGEINIQEYARCISMLIKAYYHKTTKAKRGGRGGRGSRGGGRGEGGDED
ncbi:protein S100-A6-like isoform X2 [Syngnathoides biaculeatus]|nr:protein S100-A6-like isoform X2 [Syngnathoides biaculeatus]XP_061677139.1 protein S100-A6-like isoform X2 [Syngnathoides biaculeatus]XP_061677140.1 protein S100-A6-like isoform X2 [Syngnathoides biaculeatus]